MSWAALPIRWCPDRYFLRRIMTLHEHSRHTPTLPGSVDLLRVIGNFADTVGCATDLPRLAQSLLKTLAEQLRLPEAALWIQEPGGQYRLLASQGQDTPSRLPLSLPDDHALPAWLADEAHSLRYDQNSSSPAGLAMASLHAALCLPLRNATHVLGFCTLGPISTEPRPDEETLVLAETLVCIACSTFDQLLAQDHLRRSSTLMRRTDRLRSLEILAGGFAHEIRNPLTSIKTFIQLAPQRQHDPVFIREFSQIAIQDVHRIEQLLHEILDYASYMTPQPSEVDLNELVVSCLGFVSSPASHRGIRLQTTLAPQLPLLSLDRQQIKQVLLNLLLNALDAMPNGHGLIQVRTRVLPPVGCTTWVQLQVEDEGCGISPDHIEHIFDPFFTTKHTNSASDGSGLGLTTAHQIVREHGGALLVESRIGAGSTFSVNLPIPDVRTTVSAVRE